MSTLKKGWGKFLAAALEMTGFLQARPSRFSDNKVYQEGSLQRRFRTLRVMAEFNLGGDVTLRLRSEEPARSEAEEYLRASPSLRSREIPRLADEDARPRNDATEKGDSN